MSSMGSLTTALSALYAQRRGLDVTGHNIANANTDGYTRQRVELSANAGPVAPAFYSRWTGVGQGVNVDGIARLRDAFLELRANQEHGVLGELTTKQQIVSRVELSYGEPSELGIAAQLNDFYAGFGDVANNPTDIAARRALLERASTLASNLQGTWNTLNTLRNDLVDQAQAQVTAVNELAKGIAELNDNIAVNNQAGLSIADLLDQRDLMVSQLADMVGINVKQNEGGGVDVFIGGTALVRGSVSEALKVEDSAGPPRTVSLSWAKDGYPAVVSGGSITGLMYGANFVVDDPEAGQLAKLDGIAVMLMETVNAVHAGGKDLNGDMGGIFFEGAGAADITVSADLTADPKRIAAAGADGGYADNANALALAALSDQPDGPATAYRSLIVELGVQGQTVNRRVGIQNEVTRQVDEARDAQAGVNLDEEMTNMLSYQRAYEAAARFMTAIDQMLDQLINRTGLVGR